MTISGNKHYIFFITFVTAPRIIRYNSADNNNKFALHARGRTRSIIALLDALDLVPRFLFK